jgi:hypothetical protein
LGRGRGVRIGNNEVKVGGDVCCLSFGAFCLLGRRMV